MLALGTKCWKWSSPFKVIVIDDSDDENNNNMKSPPKKMKRVIPVSKQT